MKPFVGLAEKLGLMAGQLTDSALTALEISYEGDVAELNVKPLTAAAAAGVLKPNLSEVNIVNAPALMKERGVDVAVRVKQDGGDYDSVLRLTITTAEGERTVSGALFAGEPRLIEVRGVALDAAFSEHMLFVTNDDKPGFIGSLGAALADAGVNIATFNLGRTAPGGDAMALVAVDDAVAPDVVDAVRRLPLVRQAKPLAF